MNHSALRLSLSLVTLSLLAAACATGPHPGEVSSGPARGVRLLGAVLEKETARYTQRRPDLEVDTQSGDRTPHVVATGKTGTLRLDGRRARLCGDAAGTQGWSVDNFVLLEVFVGEKLFTATVVGFPEGGVMMGKERIDNAGKMGFAFDAGEVDVTERLPENDAFTVHATALDYGGVGKVSDLYLVFQPRPSPAPHTDELKAP